MAEAHRSGNKRWLKRIAPERRALADVIARIIPKK